MLRLNLSLKEKINKNPVWDCSGPVLEHRTTNREIPSSIPTPQSTG